MSVTKWVMKNQEGQYYRSCLRLPESNDILSVRWENDISDSRFFDTPDQANEVWGEGNNAPEGVTPQEIKIVET